MKPKTSFCILSLALGTFTSVAQNTAFTYQGRLADGTGPAAGIYELRFVIYDAATQGNAVGSAMTNSATMVNNGLFTVTLDFGTGVFNGSARWLEIGVRTNGSTEGFTLLAPRHHVAATPHAIFSSTAGIISAGVIQNPTFFGTTGNAPLEIFAGSERALRIEPHNSAAPGLIGGYNLNDGAGHIGAVIAGGGSSAFRNEVQGMYGFIGSGHGGRVGAFAAVVGGANNSALGQYSFIGGGEGNSAAGRYTAVAGGRLNGNTGTYTTVAGGDGNVIQTDNTWSSVGGGRLNLIASNNFSATIAGGERNVVQTNASFAFVGGGLFNTANLEYSSVSGGRGNTSSGRYGTIGGGNGNVIEPPSTWPTIGGGRLNAVRGNNFSATIAGGERNAIEVNSSFSAIGGGLANSAGAEYTTIAGGALNRCTARHATVSGGTNNLSGGEYATLGGGSDNSAGGNYSSIGGGWQNVSGQDFTTVSGGFANQSTGPSAAIGGGHVNRASASAATVAGGFRNNATNDFATVPGGAENTAGGQYSFAAGRRAQALHHGSFVWADNNPSTFASTADNHARFRCTSGFEVITGIDATGNPTAGVYVAAGGNAWTVVSDRNAKTDFEPVNARTVLDKVAELPLSTWSYKSQTNGARHIGPMAQDFKAAFGVGESDTGITTIDADGVALAAIQGLNQKLEERTARIAALERELSELKQLVRKLGEKEE